MYGHMCLDLIKLRTVVRFARQDVSFCVLGMMGMWGLCEHGMKKKPGINIIKYIRVCANTTGATRGGNYQTIKPIQTIQTIQTLQDLRGFKKVPSLSYFIFFWGGGFFWLDLAVAFQA